MALRNELQYAFQLREGLGGRRLANEGRSISRLERRPLPTATKPGLPEVMSIDMSNMASTDPVNTCGCDHRNPEKSADMVFGCGAGQYGWPPGVSSFWLR